MPTNEANPLPEFFLLLREAFEATEDTDQFDLDSHDPSSVAVFTELQADQAETTAMLIRYVQEHGEEILAALGKSPD
ncbi:hypothetical protein [Roseomonas chloroacetimidivorans]|uniref:hypothetical protein n=1 Tax=Roseomonas chloroacetimidivorans TaxID=1766656 RepID=UPI003C74ECE7